MLFLCWRSTPKPQARAAGSSAAGYCVALLWKPEQDTREPLGKGAITRPRGAGAVLSHHPNAASRWDGRCRARPDPKQPRRSAGQLLSHSQAQRRIGPYTAEQAAIATVPKCMPAGLRRRELTILTSNRSALQVIRRPRRQSGQRTVRQIYDRIECL